MPLVRRPLVLAASAFAAGVALSGGAAAAALAASGIGALFFLRIARRADGRNAARWRWGAAALLWAAAGSARGWISFDRAAPDHFAFRVPEGGPVRCAAVLSEDPRRFFSDRGFPAGWSAVGELTRMGEKPVSGAARLVFDDAEGLSAGSRIEGVGRLRRGGPPANPGERDRGAYDRRRGILGSVSFAPGDFTAAPAPPWKALRGRAVARIARVLREGTDPRTAAFLETLLLGTRSEMPPELSRAFLETGTVHFLAVSGLHFVFILGPAAFLLRIAGASPRLRACLLIAFAAAYAWLVGFAPSVTRAAVLAAAVLAADIVGRPRDFASAMALAALGILAASPHQLFMPGFQLSFLACLAIVYLPARLPSWRGGEGRWAPARRWLSGGIALSTAAWIGTGAVVLHHFHLLTPVVIPANLVLSPLFCAALLGGALFVFAGLLGLPGGEALAAGLSFCVELVGRVAEGLAAIPGGHLYGPAPPVWGVVAFLGAVGLWTAGRRAARTGAAVAILLAAAWGAALLARSPRPGFLVLDVRHGLASILVTDDGKTVVYDCGAYGGRDPTPDVVAPALWERGVRRVDLLVLSHPHADHASGLASLLARFDVGAVCVAPGFETSPAGAGILASARAAGVSVVTAGPGGAFPFRSDAWEFDALHPPAGWAAGQANDRSLVVRARRREGCGGMRLRLFGAGTEEPLPGGGPSVLWTGDLEERGVAALLSSESDLRSDVVVIPHHGSSMALSAGLARAAAPRAAVNSAKKGFAARETLDAYAAEGARVLETARDGAVILEWR